MGRVMGRPGVPAAVRGLHVLLLAIPLVLAGCATDAPDPTTSPTPATPPASPAPAATACDPSLAAPDAAWKGEAPRVKLATTEGDVVVELDEERAPVTAANFLKLVREGYYDGESFYRVVPGFVIQGGSKTGHPQKIDDEFNPTLRHNAEGILSMATAGPDTGSSEFFITLAPTPSLDDRHAVFGKVVEGMDIVKKIGGLTPPGQSRYDGPPSRAVTITKAEVVAPRAFAAEHAVGLHVVIAEKKAEAGRGVTFATILQNKGNTRDAITLSATVLPGWTCKVSEAPTVPAGTGRVVFLTLTPPAGATGTTEVPITAAGRFAGTTPATSSVKVTIAPLGRDVKQGDGVTANYVGFLPDGRLFDTSMKRVGEDPAMPKFQTQGGWSGRSSYDTFDFTVGSGVIQGFTDLAKTAKGGETVTSLIPAKDAYAQGDMYQRPLTGRDLVFELEIVKIN